MSNTLTDLRSILRKSLSVLTDPTTSLNPDYRSISIKIQECFGMYESSSVSGSKLLGANPKGYRNTVDVSDAMMLIEAAIAEQQTLENVPDRNKIIFKKSHSDTFVDNVTITWKVKSRKPGLFDQVHIAEEQGVREYSPHVRAISDDISDIGYSIIHYGQLMDSRIEFCVTANSSIEADQAAFWFEDLIEKFKWFFAFQGLNRIFFLERGEEVVEINGANKIFKIPMLYLLRTEKTVSLKTKDIENLTINICVKS